MRPDKTCTVHRATFALVRSVRATCVDAARPLANDNKAGFVLYAVCMCVCVLASMRQSARFGCRDGSRASRVFGRRQRRHTPLTIHSIQIAVGVSLATDAHALHACMFCTRTRHAHTYAIDNNRNKRRTRERRARYINTKRATRKHFVSIKRERPRPERVYIHRLHWLRYMCVCVLRVEGGDRAASTPNREV